MIRVKSRHNVSVAALTEHTLYGSETVMQYDSKMLGKAAFYDTDS